jgi:hypothetical protein
MTKWILLVAVFILAGCAQQAVEVEPVVAPIVEEKSLGSAGVQCLGVADTCTTVGVANCANQLGCSETFSSCSTSGSEACINAEPDDQSSCEEAGCTYGGDSCGFRCDYITDETICETFSGCTFSEGACTGGVQSDPTGLCSSYNEEECDLIDAATGGTTCVWGGTSCDGGSPFFQCSSSLGVSTPCNGMSFTGCVWGTCDGTVTCSGIDDANTCETMACTTNNVCTGTATACSGLNQAQCGASEEDPQYGCIYQTRNRFKTIQ